MTCNLWRPAGVARAFRPAALLDEGDFTLLAGAIRTSRESLGFSLTAWVLLPDHWHAIIFPRHPLTISKVMKLIKEHSTYGINLRRKTSGRLWQERFFEHALRTVKEYHDAINYIHLNPLKRGSVQKPEEWKWSSVHAYMGSGEDLLPVDRLRLPADARARLF